MELLFLLGGVLIGSLVTLFILRRKTGYGTFKLDLVEDPDEVGMYTISVGLKQGQPLLDKKQIILKKEQSQK